MIIKPEKNTIALEGIHQIILVKVSEASVAPDTTKIVDDVCAAVINSQNIIVLQPTESKYSDKPKETTAGTIYQKLINASVRFSNPSEMGNVLSAWNRRKVYGVVFLKSGIQKLIGHSGFQLGKLGNGLDLVISTTENSLDFTISGDSIAPNPQFTGTIS